MMDLIDDTRKGFKCWKCQDYFPPEIPRYSFHGTLDKCAYLFHFYNRVCQPCFESYMPDAPIDQVGKGKFLEYMKNISKEEIKNELD